MRNSGATPTLLYLPLQNRNTQQGVSRMALQNTPHTPRVCIHHTSNAFSAYNPCAWQIWCFLITGDSLCVWCRAHPYACCESRIVISLEISSMLTVHLLDTINYCNRFQWHIGRKPLSMPKVKQITRGKYFSVLKHSVIIQERSMQWHTYPKWLFSLVCSGSEWTLIIQGIQIIKKYLETVRPLK